jgi:hypothetical protein
MTGVVEALSLGPAEFEGAAPAPVDVDDAADAEGAADDEGAALAEVFAEPDDDAAVLVGVVVGACAKLFTAMPPMMATLMKPAEILRRVDFIF